MNKNELKEGEIYTATNGNIVKYIQLEDKYECINGNHISGNQSGYSTQGGAFHFKDIKLSTPEEKHWLECCIAANKFIPKERVMQSFEPEFVLPEKWFIKVTDENKEILSNWRNAGGKVFDGYLNGNYGNFRGVWTPYIPTFRNPIEISFEQFKKYVLKEESTYEVGQRKVNEARRPVVVQKPQIVAKPFEIRTRCLKDNRRIKSAINAEGNIFMVNDIITPIEQNSVNKGKPFKIIGFRMNSTGDGLCAITQTHSPYGIGIDKIEHYIKPEVQTKVPFKDVIKLIQEDLKESNLDKARRLYPKGTIYKPLFGKNVKSSGQFSYFQHTKNIMQGFGLGLVYNDGVWAEILGYEPQIGDEFQIKRPYSDTYQNIIHIVTNFNGSYDNPNSVITFKQKDNHQWIGTVLLKNIKIIK